MKLRRVGFSNGDHHQRKVFVEENVHPQWRGEHSECHCVCLHRLPYSYTILQIYSEWTWKMCGSVWVKKLQEDGFVKMAAGWLRAMIAFQPWVWRKPRPPDEDDSPGHCFLKVWRVQTASSGGMGSTGGGGVSRDLHPECHIMGEWSRRPLTKTSLDILSEDWLNLSLLCRDQHIFWCWGTELSRHGI